MERYISGDSIREIAREEGRDRATVTKIVRSDEMNAVVQKMREKYYALGFDALDAVQHTLKVRKDGGLGRQVLGDIGVIPSADERYAIASQPDKATLTPFEIAVAEDENGQINRVAYGMACAMEESARCFATFLPTAEEHRRLRTVATVADEIAEGRFSQICMNDSAEEKRIRQLAEGMVECGETQRFLPPRRAQRALPHKKHVAIVGQVSARS
jgi:predicted transcriptional regulator